MTLRNIAALYRVRLRGRLAQELLALVGIAVGVALLFAALVANSSLTGSFERLTNGVIGDARFQLSARSTATLPETTLAEVQRLSGVRTAAAMLETRAEATGPGGRASVVLFGVTPEFGQLGGAFPSGFSYRFLADVRAVAMPTPIAEALGLALAQPVALVFGERAATARLGAKLQEADIRGGYDSPVALAPLDYAQELTGEENRITRVLVVPRRGAERAVGAGLERIAGEGADVRPADDEARVLRQASMPTSQSTVMFSVFGALVGFLFAFSAMLLTVPGRQRLVADLSLEGYGTPTIVRILLFDALVLGVAASALGILLGDQVARLLFDETPNFLTYAFTIGQQRVVSASSVAIAAAGGLAASCAAVLGPTTGTLLDVARGGTSHGARWPLRSSAVVIGAATLVAGLAVVVAAPASAAVGIGGLVCLTAAMLLLLPALLRTLIGALEVATSRMHSVVTFLAIFDLRARNSRSRVFAVAATGAVAVCGSVALQGAHEDLLRGLDRTSADVTSMADVWALAPGEANLLVTTPFEPPRLKRSSALARTDEYRGSFLDIGDKRAVVFGPPPSGPFPLSKTQVLAGDVDSASARLRTGGWVVLSEGLARDLGVGVGDAVTLPSPVPRRLHVAALSTNLGWPPGAIVLNAEDYERAWGSGQISALLATVAAGSTPADGAAALRRLLGPRSNLAVSTASERAIAQHESSRTALARLEEIGALVLVAAVVAMAAAMAGLIWQRRDFIASVKVEGYSTGEMWRALLLESVLLIGAGCVIGATFGLLGQGLLSRALTSVTGFPVVYAFAGDTAVIACVVVAGAAISIVAAAGMQTARVEPRVGVSD